MAIVIPALLNTQLTAFRAGLNPRLTAATSTFSSLHSPSAMGSRAADLLRLLTDLCNSGVLTVTALSTAFEATDLNAFTGVNSLVGCTATFTGNVTAALTGVTGVVQSNTVSVLTFGTALPAAPNVGDTFTLEFTAIDKDLHALDLNKGMGASHSNPFGPGPSLINALERLIRQLGGAVPAWLTAGSATPFHVGSPHAGGMGNRGHGGTALIAEAFLAAQAAVAAWTIPA